MRVFLWFSPVCMHNHQGSGMEHRDLEGAHLKTYANDLTPRESNLGTILWLGELTS